MGITVTEQFIVENELGLHARPSSSFVKKATEFQSAIEVIKNEEEKADGKSLISLICLGAGKGTKLTVKATGTDAEKAIYAIGALFKNKFGEK